MKRPRFMRTGVIAVACALVGAAGGIASGTAAKHKSTAKPQARAAAFPPGPPGRGFDGRRGPAVHEEEVVLNKAGTAFITATEDSGRVESVSGDQLTLKEGTPSVTYKTVTLTIPAGAKVYRNGAAAKLSDLKAGDHAHVSSSSDGTVVFAGDANHGPGHGPGGRGFRGGGPGGPPPAGPPPMG